MLYPIMLKLQYFYTSYFSTSHTPIIIRRVICQFKINYFGVGSESEENNFCKKIHSLNLTIAC